MENARLENYGPKKQQGWKNDGTWRKAIVTRRRIFAPSDRFPAPCGLRGCKNRLAPFPGRMSYKATKPGSVCPLLA